MQADIIRDAGPPVSSASSDGQPAVGADDSGQYVTFTCADRVFGIDVMSVREIRRWSPTTPLPGQPYGAHGVMDIRGRVVEVYDLAALVDEPGSTAETNGKVVVVISLGIDEAAIIVDSVSDIIFARPDDMRTPPKGSRDNGRVSTLVASGEKLVAILDLGKLLPGYAADETFHTLAV